MNLRKRLLRHLSFANVVACMALFVALGGGAYAATNINGGSIKKETIGGNKLKKETITSKQIKKGTLNSSVIDVSSLTTVPSAQTAVTANSANTASSANTAKTAESATKADSAGTAGHADSADSATHADSAGTATDATDADHATSADSATEAEKFGGETPSQLSDRLTVACDPSTDPFGGMCWDKTPRPITFWVVANEQCAAAGGRLPSLGELIAYVRQPEEQFSGQAWSGDVVDITGGVAEAASSGETVRAKAGEETVKLGFRCVFLPSNVHNG